MKKITVLLVLLFTTLSFAQQGINYKAVIKDGGGNVIASTPITVEFTIYEGAGETTIAYQETHTPTTDSNGIIILNIGEGAVDSGVFANIDWATDDHYLNTQIDTGGGLTDMGTSQFMAVPYALHAANVSGLEALDEGNGIGYRLIGRDPDYSGNIGLAAIDLSVGFFLSTTTGATGDLSTAMGGNSVASGDVSTAMGWGTTASGDYSIATGYGTNASGDNSTAMGSSTNASSIYSTAIGRFNIGGGTADSWVVTDPLFEIGNGDAGTSANALTVLKNGHVKLPATMDASDIPGTGVLEIAGSLRFDGNEIITNTNALLYINNNNNGDVIIDNDTFRVDASANKVGIGTATPGTIITNAKMDVVGGHIAVSNNYGLLSYNSEGTGIGAGFDTDTDDALFLYAGGLNRLTVGNTGHVTAPSFSIAGINTAGNKALITKEYADANYNGGGVAPTGLEEITEAGKTGHRIIGRNPSNHGNIGTNAVDLSYSSSALDKGATGNGSTALGFSTTASGENSTAMGNGSTASGYGSTAIGTSTAIYEHSTAIGYLAVAEGKHSVAIGRSTNAVRDGSLSTGWFTRANGVYSTAMGFNTIAESYISTAIGRYNVGNGSYGGWVLNEPIFEIGIGSSITNKKNAMTVLKGGNVGIGTANPVFPLHVTTRNSGVGDASPNHYLANGGVGINGSNWTYSIGATYGIWSGVGFAVSSDSRIKNIIGQSNSADDLSKLMKIEVTDYQYIDTVNKGSLVIKKVVAQQVKEVFPNAVNLTTGFIPNVYAMATVEVLDETSIALVLTEKIDIVVGDIIKIIPKEKPEIQVKVISIIENRMTVAVETTTGLGNQLFVYGKQVDDFHSVDYDAISMLNVSATQAQQKLIENLQNEVGELKQVITEYKSIEQRLSLLETANSNEEGATVEIK